MINDYRIAVNLEITSKCNARCSMCPRDEMPRATNMSSALFKRALSVINPSDVSRTILAGYGEPTTHPDFDDYIEQIKGHPVRFDMATNGELLTEERLKAIDGTLGLMLISFSSIVPEVYQHVHRLLDHRRVMDNIRLAQRTLKKTAFGISLSPVPMALATLTETIDWLRKEGINALTMSPTLYNRAGSSPDQEVAPAVLRELIAEHNLHSQELDFVTGAKDFMGQWLNNRFRCVPRNTDLLIAATGDYQYCFNDINHTQVLGNIGDMSIRQALAERSRMESCPSLCNNCNMKDRYHGAEILQVAVKYGANRLAAALA